jgi:7-cyano-7-deazaguanine synthase
MQEQYIVQNKLIKNVIVLCSSGLDSTYNLLKAVKVFGKQNVKAVFLDYSQKSAPQEYLHTQKTCKFIGVDFTRIELNWFRDLNSTLLSKKMEISRFESLDKISNNDKPAEWVPNRNGVFVNVVASLAESMNIDGIIIGINKEEAGRYPDNTPEFLERVNALFEYSTLSKPKIFSFTVDMIKTDIIKDLFTLFTEFNVKIDAVWSCYDSYEKMCGRCESCLRLKNALKLSFDVVAEAQWKDLFLK